MNGRRVVAFDLDASRVIAEVSGTPRDRNPKGPAAWNGVASAAGNHAVASDE